MSLHDPMLRRLRSLLLSSGLLCGLLLASGQAQVTTTITPDGTLGTAVTQSGTFHDITGGTRPGNGPNLFHSFDRFTVGTNDTARFSGPTGIVNILSRVTGGQQSVIDGRLQSTIPGANLYLLNPSGVLFGPSVSLDIKGSFHVSTADFLRFADGATFSAHVGQNSTLTVAPPSAFGFLGPTPARIDILGSTLEASAGQTLSVVGGDLGSTSFFSIPTLSAPGGRIHLVSVASSGEVGFDPTGRDPALQVNSFVRLGEMNLQDTRLDVSSDGGGTIVIRGGRLTVANTSITAVTGDRDGIKVGIDLRLAEDVVVENSFIGAGSSGRGNVGEIRAEAGTLTLRMGAVIGSLARGSGKGGDITVSARESISISGRNDQGLSSGIGTFAAAEPGRISLLAPSVTIDGAVVGTPSLAAGGFVGGRAGDVVVQADNLTLSGDGGISSGTATDSDGGSITIETGQLTVRGGAQISASSGFRDLETGTIVAGRGAAGNVTVMVSEAASLSGRGNGLSSHAQSGSSNAGDIGVRVGRLTMSDGAQITSSTLGPGAGGSVRVMATDTITLAGAAPTGRISGIAVTTAGAAVGAGAAGNIMVSAPRILVSDGAQITSSTFGPGAGGSVTVMATDTLTLAGTTSTGTFGSGILANAQGVAMGAGAAGNIMVSAPRILVSDGGQIISSTFGPGAGGSVLVTATDTLTLSGTTPTGIFASGILATTEGSAVGAGAAGNITVNTPHILVSDGAQINGSTFGPGTGGSVTVTASDTVTLRGAAPAGRVSGIFANAQGTAMGAGAAGSIVVTAPRALVSDGAAISSSTLGPGTGGSVTVTVSDTVTLRGTASTGRASGILATTEGLEAGAGAAGSIVVTAPRVLVSDGAAISSSTLGPGLGGSVTVTATDSVTLSGTTPMGAFASGIFANAQGTAMGAGAAGSIVVTAPRVLVSDGAGISSGTLGPGAGGSVMVTATDTLTLRGTTPTGAFASGIFATTEGIEVGAGAAGSIVVTAPHITVTDGAGINSSTLGPGAGGSVMVTATDTLTLRGTTPTGAFASGIFANAQGTAMGAGAAGSIVVTAPRVLVSDGAVISSSTFGPGTGGSVTVMATDTLTLSGTTPTGAFASGILANAQGTVMGAGAAGSIVVTAPRALVSDGAVISSSTFGPGTGGSVTVTVSDTVTLRGTASTGRASGILATTEGLEAGAGAAGSIVVTAPRVLVSDGAGISSGTLGPGAGGSVMVTATDTLTLRGTTPTGAFASGIFATTEGIEVGAGAAGSIVVTAPHITVTDGAGINSSTLGPGAGGSVMVTATDTLTLRGTTPTGAFASGIFANAQGTAMGAGAAGSIVVTAPRVLVSDGAVISSSTFGPGSGGSVTVMATDTVSLSGAAILSDAFGRGEQAGNAGRISLTTPVLTMDREALIETRTFGNGNAGDVEIVVGRMTMTGAAQIGSTSGLITPDRVITAGIGKGGTVTITATDAITITGRDLVQELPSGVFTQTVGPGDAGRVVVSTPQLTIADGAQIGVETSGDGRGGDVTVWTGHLSLTGGAQIRSGSGLTALGTLFIGAGAGGTVSVTATDTIDIVGQESGLSASTAGQGRGGDVLLQARQVRLTDGATISAESTGLGNAGNVTIVAGDTFQSTNSSVVTRATQADGGNIQITAPTLVRLRDSAITAEVGGGPQTVGGNIIIDPQFVLLQNSQIVANAFAGQGGNIRIQAQVFLADPASIVSASSALGINGVVNIQAPVTSISGAVAPLPQEFAPISELLRDRCAGRLREGRVSRLVLGGRDGVPSEPGSLLLSPLIQMVPRADGEQTETPARTGQVQERARYVLAGTLEGLEAECARWTGQKGPTVRNNR